MDTLFTRLEEASSTGDADLLKELLKKDKLLLDKVIGRTSVRDNPLHIAAMLGHADFVREVIHRKPELAKEFNVQGLSPLHLAAAHGHVTVVKEFLKADLDLCLIREKQEGLLPLHIAVKKGRTLIVEELVEACEEAVHRPTNGGDTLLHLAIKYNSFDTVEFLIDRVHDPNAKDDRGNTILHHAVASKQLSVIKFLLSKTAIDVNAMNLKFSTPLDVLLESWPQNGDLILGEMIRAAGGKIAAELLSNSEPVNRDSISSDSSNSNPIIPTPKLSLWHPHCLSAKNEIEKLATSKLQKEKQEKKYDPQILLLVAALVATVTFQAALNPPGGFKPNGQLVLQKSLDNFQVFDLFALFLSVSVMMLMLCVVPRKKKCMMKFLVLVIWCATFSMGLAITQGIPLLYDDENKGYSKFFFAGWFLVLRLGISWVLIRFLIFLVKKSRLCDAVPRRFASLKRGCFFKWQQFGNITKMNRSNCCGLFKKVSCILLILCVLPIISFVWLSYMIIPIW